MLDAIQSDWTTAPVPPRLAGALALVHHMTREPARVDAAFLDDLRARGLDDADIEAASTVAVRYAFINRAADVFAFPIPSEEEFAVNAAILSRMNRWIRVRPPEPLFVEGEDGLWRPTDLEGTRRQLLETPGVTSPQLRRDVEAFAAGWFGGVRPDVSLEEPVLGFVGRVAAFPASMDDAGVQVLRDAGLDDEAIFELTMAAALGVACAGAEPLAALLGPRG